MISATHGTRPVVLVVEDDFLSQRYVERILRRDFTPLLAASGVEARAQLIAHPDVAVILMDLSLKGDEDGLALTRWLRDDPRWRRVPIIATTAHALVEDQRRTLGAGCSAHLAKPFSPDALRNAIRQARDGGLGGREGIPRR